MCYFTPMKHGAYKLYSTPNDSYWCCVGTGFENHAKYGESIYVYDKKHLYKSIHCFTTPLERAEDIYNPKF